MTIDRKSSNSMKKTPKQSLTKLADAAFMEAALTVIKRAQETGTPVIVWENGAIKKLNPRKMKKSRGKTRAK
jgi:hypothetical protein